MKTKFLAIVASVLLFVSCSDFLEIDPETALTDEQIFGSLDKMEPLVLGSLTSWRNLQKDRGGLIVQLGTDESKQGAYQVTTNAEQASFDYYNGFLSAENSVVSTQWDSRVKVIGPMAQAIYFLNLNEEEDEARKSNLLGQASFVRAVMMFELAMYWGEIQIIDYGRVAELGGGRQPLEDVFTYIINDLTVAEANLPATQDNPALPTKGLAQAMLGKVYLSAPEASTFRNYELSKSWFEKLINSGAYNLVPSYASLFSPFSPNSQESIYEFQFNNVWPDNNQIQWQTGSRAVANRDQYAYFGGYDLLLPTEYCYEDKANGGIWEPGDLRKNASIRYDFTYQGTVPPIPAGVGGDELDPHIKKYEDLRTQGALSFWYSGKNKPYLRYADVLLCYAECLNELGNTAEAEDYVNQVRARGFGGTLPPGMAWSGLSQSDFRTNIMDERMRELAFEGWRRMDLIRTGKLVDLVSAHNPWANEGGTIANFHNRYPIPETEIVLNLDIDETDQNEGY
ncbi:RagB/SusD family nutrient uptake outer membrane protein [Flavivirga sp. 57AJ16]|uniref:RagB/SusD family nutrient uptake outer membrane protein n=1 Tax=Flavivirga sp. 57AJ16 TaxID=3025307 RepID=UPI00236588D3|nr:RagB/SusD family nutrient uptake outer membrane protein [Flavivirga sp. 57AJ16]MDD7885373.1 RagB/SusD family nutrient uptake outer membrane protein [Flavivirga sp. 57AJ16]